MTNMMHNDQIYQVTHPRCPTTCISLLDLRNINNENYDIALAMSSSRADPVLGHCPGWEYLNI